jgi:HEAT repeat protein
MLLFTISLGCLLRAPLPARAVESEEQLLGILKSNAPPMEKAWACRELKRMGTERSVPALAALLTDKDVSHSARYALETMPYPEAGAALREALGKASGVTKAGIINTIGERGDREAAVLVLVPLLQDQDVQVASAAAVALGKIHGFVLTKVDEKLLPHLAEGALLAVENALRAGRRAEAAQGYQTLSKAGASRAIHYAALQGMLKAAGEQRHELVLRWLGGSDADARAIAAGQIEGLSAGQLKSLAAGAARLPAASQVSVLGALALRGDGALLPAVIEATKSKSDEVRLAAIKALGQLGDASVVPLLIETMFIDEKARATARRSLEIVRAKGADEQIITLLQQEKDFARRAELIDVLDARRAISAVPALLKEALGEDAGVRTRAMSALGRLAEPKDISGMVQGLLKADKGAERDNAEKAVMFVCQQITPAETRADPVLAVVANAGQSQQAAVLPMLGRIGAPKALELIRAALASKHAELYEAGVRAICNWPDAAVADQLLKLAQGAAQPNHRIWALRAFVRVVSLPSDTPDAQKLALLKQAMQLSTRDDERNLVLERSAAVRTVETLRFVLPYVDQPELAEQACRAVVELAHHRGLREPNKKEFDAALEKVIKLSKDSGTVERAKRYLQGL